MQWHVLALGVIGYSRGRIFKCSKVCNVLCLSSPSGPSQRTSLVCFYVLRCQFVGDFHNLRYNVVFPCNLILLRFIRNELPIVEKSWRCSPKRTNSIIKFRFLCVLWCIPIYVLLLTHAHFMFMIFQQKNP